MSRICQNHTCNNFPSKILSYTNLFGEYYCTYSNTMYEEKIVSILKNVQFSGKGRQLLHM